MRSRQRGAAWLLALLVAGRLLDRLDLPFERRAVSPGVAGGTPTSPAAPPAGTDGGRASVVTPVGAAVRAGTDSTPPPESRTVRDATPVAINRATPAELQRLPGVGPVLAGRILAHRRAHGPFRNLADLRAVRGIGPRTCERLASWVRFD